VQELEERRRVSAQEEAPASAFVTTGHAVSAAPEEYPALVGASSSGGGTGWTRGQRGGRGAEDFPSLGGGGARGQAPAPVPAYGPGPGPGLGLGLGSDPPGMSLGALAGKSSKLREKEQRKAQAKQVRASERRICFANMCAAMCVH